MKKGFILGLAVLLLSSCGSLKPPRQSNSKVKPKPRYEHEVLNNEMEEGLVEKPSVDKEESSTVSLKSLDDFIDDWYGTPHKMGGMSKKGVDCSGFVIIAYREIFEREFEGRRAEDLFAEMEAIELSELKYGDLVFFKVKGRRIDHVGIYLGDLKFVHTSSSRGVMVSALSNSYWQKRFFRGGRYKN